MRCLHFQLHLFAPETSTRARFAAGKVRPKYHAFIAAFASTTPHGAALGVPAGEGYDGPSMEYSPG
jgi:hypothetical protein